MWKTSSFGFSIGFVFVLIVLLYLTLKEAPDKKFFEISHIDKLAHFFFFAVLGFLFSGSLYIELKLASMTLVILTSTVVLLGIGIGIELLQLKIPGRSGSFGDGLADFLGAVVGAYLYMKYSKLKG